MGKANWQTVAQQAVDPRWAGKGPQGQNLVAWRNQKTGKTISGSDWGNSAYAEPIWGPAPQQSGGNDSGGNDGGNDGGNGGEDLPGYEPLYQAIINDLQAPKFDANQFNKRMNTGVDEQRLKAEALRRTMMEGLNDRGVLKSGMGITGLKDIGQAENKDILTNIQQLQSDEQKFLQDQRDRGVKSATDLFSTQVQHRTQQAMAKMQQEFAMKLLASQQDFAAQQKDLDRALEREKAGMALAAAGQGGGNNFLNFLGGAVSGASPFIAAGLK